MDVPTLVFELLQSATEPLTAAQLVKQLPGKTPARLVTAALEDLANGGRVRAFAQGKATAYALRAPLDLCAQALARQVAQLTEAMAPAGLKKRVSKSLLPWFDEALGRLVVQGVAYWLPKGKNRLVLPRPVRPSDVLSPTAMAALKKVLAEANRQRHQPRNLAGLLAWLDAPGEAPAEAAAVGEPTARPTPELLHQWYLADRARASSAMVPIPHTWKHYETWAAGQGLRADIVDFRQVLEALYNAGGAMLEPCERPQDLPEEERHLQVPLSIGPPGYYWSPMV